MRPEARVGLFFLISLLIISAMVMFLTDWLGRRGTYQFDVVFSQAQGLEEGAPVYMSGVRIGDVAGVGLTAGNKARVTLRIRRGVRIMENYEIAIGTGALIGEKRIEIVAVPVKDAGKPMPVNAVVDGVDKPRLEDMVEASTKLVMEMRLTMADIRSIFGDPKISAALRDGIIGFGATGVRLAALTERINEAAEVNATNLSALTRNLAGISADLHTVSGQLAEADLPADLAASTRALRSTTERVDAILASLEPLANNPQIGEEIRQSVTNVAVATDQARQAATAARSTVARVERVLAPIDMRSTADLMYLTNPDRRWAELNLDFRRGSADFARIGVADIGEFTRWNLQVGRPLGPGNVRLGLLQSKFGLGYDAWLSPRFGLTAEVFDPNDIRANLMGQYYFRPAPDGWAALLGLRDIGGDPRLAIGVRLQN